MKIYSIYRIINTENKLIYTYGAANKGRTFKPETLAKMSEAAKQRPANRPKGSITSDATRQKQSQAAKGRTPWNKGLKMSKQVQHTI